jgi:hypothetical protein
MTLKCHFYINQVQAGVALKRIDVFMNSDELEEDDVNQEKTTSGNQENPTMALQIKNATFKWGGHQVWMVNALLQIINPHFSLKTLFRVLKHYPKLT